MENIRQFGRLFLGGIVGMLLGGHCFGADQPQLGQAWTRNVVSGETGLPDYFDPVSGSNIA